MRIVLGEKKLHEEYAEKLKAIPASEMCGIKYIEEDVDLYIVSKVLDDGIIENTNLCLEEVLITLKVKNIFYKYENTKYLSDAANFYQVNICTDYSV